MAVEDFTTYTESDPGGTITVTSTKIDWSALSTRDTESYVYDDKGVGHFSGDFEHDLHFKITSSNNLAWTSHWELSNTIDDHLGIVNASGDALLFRRYNSSGTTSILLQELDGGTTYSATAYTTTENTDYYCTADRDEAIGTYGQLRLRTYSDAARTTLLNTQTISLHSSKKDFRYVYGLNTFNSSLTGLSTGFTENLDLKEAAGTTIPVFINHYRNQGIM